MLPSEEMGVLRVCDRIHCLGDGHVFEATAVEASFAVRRDRSAGSEILEERQEGLGVQKNHVQGQPQFSLQVGARLPGFQVIVRPTRTLVSGRGKTCSGLRLQQRVLCAPTRVGTLGGEVSLSWKL